MNKESAINSFKEAIEYVDMLISQKTDKTPSWLLNDIKSELKKDLKRIKNNRMYPKEFRRHHFYRYEDEGVYINKELMSKVDRANRCYLMLPNNFRFIDIFVYFYWYMLCFLGWFISKLTK